MPKVLFTGTKTWTHLKQMIKLLALDAWYFNGALVEDYNYIGWGQDMDGDGECTLFNDGFHTYRFAIGASTMPAIACGDNGEVAVAWAGISEVDV